jgi:hypothetical protein
MDPARTMSSRVQWFLRRVALVGSPLPLIAGAALAAQGKVLDGIALALAATAMYWAGRDTRGQRSPP